MQTGPFTENVVLITGASRGIGEALAYQLADQGAWLALAGRDRARLEAVVDGCQSRGGRAIHHVADVVDPEQCRGMVETAAAHYARIDTLINNTGITMWAKFEEVQDLSIYAKII